MQQAITGASVGRDLQCHLSYNGLMCVKIENIDYTEVPVLGLKQRLNFKNRNSI